MPNLSPKQKRLFDKVQKICHRADTLELPVKIDEVWGFGSAIRGKEAPGDIDLVVKYTDFHPSYELFKTLSQDALLKYGWLDNPPATPKEALVKHMSAMNHDDHTITLFGNWLEGISWDVIHRHLIPQMFGWDWQGITRRILHRGIRQVHVMQVVHVSDKNIMAAKAFQLFWSRSKPNLLENLELVLSTGEVRKSCLTEIANFEGQSRPLKFGINVLRTAFHTLIVNKRHFKDYDQCTIWLSKQTKAKFPRNSLKQIKAIIEYPGSIDEETVHVDLASRLSKLSIEQLKTEVEAMRNELKQALKEFEVLKQAFYSLRDLKISQPAMTRSELEQSIVLRTLDSIPKYFVSEIEIRTQLQALELQADKPKL